MGETNNRACNIVLCSKRLVFIKKEYIKHIVHCVEIVPGIALKDRSSIALK